MLPAVEQRCREISRRRFAGHAGINDGHLGRILAGTRRPSAATLAKLARTLGDGSGESVGAEAAAAAHAKAQAAPDLPAGPEEQPSAEPRNVTERRGHPICRT